jgi:hypothetical protein
MNSIKGDTWMMLFWADAGLVRPIKLMNQDNAAAAEMGGDAAKARASSMSQAGAVKITSLVGAVFQHKDKKKGQQDTLQVHLQIVIGFMVCFLNTSNSHYQLHCEAAVELGEMEVDIDEMELGVSGLGCKKRNRVEEDEGRGMVGWNRDKWSEDGTFLDETEVFEMALRKVVLCKLKVHKTGHEDVQGDIRDGGRDKFEGKTFEQGHG